MKKSFFIKYIAVALCLFTVVCSFMQTAMASDWQDDDCSVTIFFVHDGEPIINAHFRLYRIADSIDDLQNNKLIGDFEKYDVTIEDVFDSDYLAELASTLSAYAARDALVPDAQGDTNNKGALVFDNLLEGVYLIDGNCVREGDEVYLPQPFIVYLPIELEGEMQSRVVANVKYEYVSSATTPVERKVLKVWDDAENPNRPKKIVVQLLCDGSIYDEVTLSDENNWRHTWTDLDAFHLWQLVEKNVPGDYTVVVSREGNTFVVTNTYAEEIPEDGWPTEPSTDGSEGTTAPGGNTPGGNTPGGNTPGNLPNTGLLWWPVPVLIVFGFALFAVGFAKRKRTDDEEA